LEQEKPVEKAREQFNLEGVGEFTAKKGTAVHEIAGAAVYWQNQCLTAEKRFEEALEKVSEKKWKDGFLTGSVSTAIIGLAVELLLRFY
jgi:hypothetical protein